MNPGFTNMIQEQKDRVKSGGSHGSKKTRKSHDHAHYYYFFFRGEVHHEFVPTGETVNAAFCVQILKRFCDRVRRVRPELWAEKNWLLHHDNAPSYTALTVREFIAKNNIVTIDHFVYSPDLVPRDFFYSLK